MYRQSEFLITKNLFNMTTKSKKYATMTASGATIVTAKSKKEAAAKLQVSVKDVYLYA